MIPLSDKDIRRFWSKVSLPDGQGCMLWNDEPLGSGYGRMQIGANRSIRAHRMSLLLAEGPPPEGKPEAAHGCRNKLCVAPDHLRWASRKENDADRRRDGTLPLGERNGGAKLTTASVIEIRNLYATGRVRQVDLATRYGVRQSAISAVVTGKRWK